MERGDAARARWSNRSGSSSSSPGHVTLRYRGLAKNTSQLHTLFALVNLWLVRGKCQV